MRRPGRILLASGALLAACAPHRPVVTLPRGDVDRPHEGFVEADDGPHPSSEKDYFEWWYFDATFDDGTTATLGLYARETFSHSHNPAVLISFLEPSGQVESDYYTRSPSQLAFGTAPGDVRVGESFTARGEGGALRVHVTGTTKHGDHIAADLTFRGTMPGFKPGDGTIRLDGKVAFGWVVPMPRATVEGTLLVGARERQVKGFGYHDHNWGELNLLDTMAYWYWGRVASGDATVVYASIYMREGLGVAPISFALVGDGKRLAKTLNGLSIRPLAAEFLPGASRTVPRGVEMTSDGFHARLTSTKVLDAQDGAATMPPWLLPLLRLQTHPAYVRRLCDYTLESTLEGVPASSSGQAIAEFMYIWNKD